MNRFVDLINDEDFWPKFRIALQPGSEKSPEAEEILRLLLPLVQETGKKINWSPAKRAKQLSVLYGMIYRYGLPSDFITVSQLSAANGLVIKLASGRLGEDARVV